MDIASRLQGSSCGDAWAGSAILILPGSLDYKKPRQDWVVRTRERRLEYGGHQGLQDRATITVNEAGHYRAPAIHPHIIPQFLQRSCLAV